MRRVAVLFLLAVFFSKAALCYDNTQHSPPKGGEVCYNYSTIAYDSVINSRLGVSPETMVEMSKNSDGTFDLKMLKVISGAYSWQQSPHDYAIQTFMDCLEGTL